MYYKRLLITLVILLINIFTSSAQDARINGLMRTNTNMDYYSSGSVVDLVRDRNALVEAMVQVRIMLETDPASRKRLYVHYENSFSKGEYLSAYEALEGQTGHGELIEPDNPKDANQLFRMTQEYRDENGQMAYHRLDRLYFAYTMADAEVRVGRQAVYWGRGRLFQVADMVHPYAPTDTLREYKNGRDMLNVQKRGWLFDDVNILLVPGRDVDENRLKAEKSSLLLRMTSNRRFSLYTGIHMDDPFVAAGGSLASGYAKYKGELMAARGDKTYVTALMNASYEWLTLDNITIGFAELYGNTLGVGRTREIEDNPDLNKKLDNGDVSLRDRYYGALGLKYKVAKGAMLRFQSVVNLRDGSYILQPVAEWYYKPKVKVAGGVDFPVGVVESEFGGFRDEVSGAVISPAKRVYGQVTLYF